MSSGRNIQKVPLPAHGAARLFRCALRALRSIGYIQEYAVRVRDDYVTLKLARILTIRLQPDTARWIGHWLIVAAERADRGDDVFVSSNRRAFAGPSVEPAHVYGGPRTTTR